MSNAADFFDGIEDPELSAGGAPRFKPGKYLIQIKECRISQGHHGTRYVVEGEVLDNGDNPEADPIGAVRAWTTRLDGQYPKIGKAESKGFYQAMTGQEPTKADMAATLADGGNKFAGMTVNTEAYNKTTNSGNTITKHTWDKVDGQTAAPAPVVPVAPAENFPPAGWVAHPDAAGYFFKGQEVLTEAQLRAR